ADRPTAPMPPECRRRITRLPGWKCIRLLKQRRRHAADAQQPRPDVSADHGADLRDEQRLGAEDLAAALDESLCLVASLDVLDDPGVGAVLGACAEVVGHALEGATGSADALDRGDLRLDGEDRLDLERRSDP